MKTKVIAASIILAIAAGSFLAIHQDAQRKEDPLPLCPPFCVATCAKLDRAWIEKDWKE